MRIIKVGSIFLAFAILLLFPVAIYAQNNSAESANLISVNLIPRIGIAAIYFAFGFLHFLLYIFYPRNRANILFSILAFSMSSVLVCVILAGLLPESVNLLNSQWKEYSRVALYLSVNVAETFLPLFLYQTFSSRIPKYFWVYLALKILNSLLQPVLPPDGVIVWFNSLLGFFLVFEAVRIMAVAVFQRREGAILVGCGVLLHCIAPLRRALEGIGLETPSVLQAFNTYYALGLVVAASIYLARQFAQTNTNLETQLVREVEHERDKARFLIVEAENERRAKELEEARQLQLSMLPKKLPKIEGLEIAAYMKPATEVGGDYYDFHASPDGTLTVVVGDATGHGLKAGSVVTATKGLFNAFAKQESISLILKEIGQALKQMNLRGLFMAMTMLKVKGNVMTASLAGMPAALLYRADTQAVEEITIRAMPLGSIAKSQYEERQFVLADGDCIVLMSDGFPEMFNPNDEMLGFEKAAEILPSVAANSAQEIINHLVKVGEDWASGRPQDDDVTFVVLKIKSDGK